MTSSSRPNKWSTDQVTPHDVHPTRALGWGYTHTSFRLNSLDELELRSHDHREGSRNQFLPNFVKFAVDELGAELGCMEGNLRREREVEAEISTWNSAQESFLKKGDEELGGIGQDGWRDEKGMDWERKADSLRGNSAREIFVGKDLKERGEGIGSNGLEGRDGMRMDQDGDVEGKISRRECVVGKLEKDGGVELGGVRGRNQVGNKGFIQADDERSDQINGKKMKQADGNILVASKLGVKQSDVKESGLQQSDLKQSDRSTSYALPLDELNMKLPNDVSPFATATFNPSPLSQLSAICEATTDIWARLRRSHGHSCQEIYRLRFEFNKETLLKRIPDVVVFPETRNDVRRLIDTCASNNWCMIPVGGCTNVTRAVEKDLKKFTICADTRKMNRIVWLDQHNGLARVESGIRGIDLEQRVNKFGLTLGHEPDSIEFSTLGGWISTKASGMKRARYGNIENIVVSVNMETPLGTLGTRNDAAGFERSSSGPDLALALALGSEGTLGLITDCVLKLRPLPSKREYGSMLFGDFESGVRSLRDLAKKNLLPASARLMDNTQFRLGQALKPSVERFETKSAYKESIKRFYIETLNGLDPATMCAATFVYEGFSNLEIASQKLAVFNECRKHGGVLGDAESGKRGYFLTFYIAYLRDFGLYLNFLSESFEATVPWSNVSLVKTKVETVIRGIAKREQLKEQPMIGMRVSQAYDTCCCVYFYFGFVADDCAKRLHTFTEMEHEARRVIVEECAGSISHHHGVGKAKKDFFNELASDAQHELMSTIKSKLDPTNVFAVGNLNMNLKRSRL